MFIHNNASTDSLPAHASGDVPFLRDPEVDIEAQAGAGGMGSFRYSEEPPRHDSHDSTAGASDPLGAVALERRQSGGPETGDQEGSPDEAPVFSLADDEED